MTNTFESNKTAKSSTVAIALSWLVVLIPAAWGVYNTVLRAAHLFR